MASPLLSAGYSGTPLAKKLGPRDGQRVLLVLVTGIAMVVSSAAVMAIEVRTASEEEIAAALIGCWQQEWTFEHRQYEEEMSRDTNLHRIPYSASACFKADGTIDTGWIGGDEGMEGWGAFELAHGKLQLMALESGDAWIFDAYQLECDVIMSPSRAMKLTNCVGLGEDAGKAVPDSSYEFRDD